MGAPGDKGCTHGYFYPPTTRVHKNYWCMCVCFGASGNPTTDLTLACYAHVLRVRLCVCHRTPEQPFFLYVPFQNVHDPYSCSKEVYDIFEFNDQLNRQQRVRRRPWLLTARALASARSREREWSPRHAQHAAGSQGLV